MKNHLTILVDMDDTIEYLLKEWLDYLNSVYHTNVTEYDIHEYDITKAFPDLEPNQVYQPLFDPELWKRVKPVPGARYAIERLQQDGHDVYIVTSSNYNTIYVKIDAILHRYFPTIDDAHVIIARKKQMIRGDVMVDDAPHNLIDGEYLKIMPTAAHNRDFNEYECGIIRVNDWDDIYGIIHEYAEFTSAMEDLYDTIHEYAEFTSAMERDSNGRQNQ